MHRREALLAALPVPFFLLGATAASRTAAMTTASPIPSDDAIAARLRAGRVAVLLRHSITDPGIGDPPGLRIGRCATQRNLSAEGRAQAQRIGAWFKARELAPAQVRSSAWCRCIDTGTLAFGQANVWPPLNSFFGEPGTRERQTTALAAALPGIPAGTFEVWVTHQVNVTALTGDFAEMGAACLVERAASSGPVRVIGRFSPSA